MFAALEARLEKFWSEVTGEARAEVETALSDLKAEVAKAGPLLGQFEADIRAAVAAAAPEVSAAVEDLVAKLIEDAAAILGPKM